MKHFLIGTFAVLLLATPLMAQTNEVQVRIDGLTCPLCAYGLEKRLKKMDDVASISLDQPNGLLRAKAKPGKMIDLDTLTAAITGTGFTPRQIQVTVTGRMEQWNGRPTLFVADEERLFLAPPEKVQEVQKALGKGHQLVTISGVASHPDEHKEHPFTVAITKFELR